MRIDKELRSFFDAQVDIAGNLVTVDPGDQRTHLRAGRGAVGDLEARDTLLHPREQCLGRTFADGDRHRDRHASLARRTEGCARERVRRLVHVRIRHDDHVILRAAQGLHALAGGRAAAIHVFRNRRRAHETDGGNPRMIEDRIHHPLIAMHHVEYAIRQPGFLQQFRKNQRSGRIALARFENETVTSGKSNGQHPQRHHGGEVERRDACDHAQRLPERPAIDPGADLLGEFTFQQVRNAGSKLHHFETTRHFSACVIEHLAVFCSDDRCQPVCVLLQQIAETKQNPRPAQRRHIRPFRECRCRRGDGLFQLHCRIQRNAALDFPGGRIEHVSKRFRLTCNRLAAYPVGNGI